MPRSSISARLSGARRRPVGVLADWLLDAAVVTVLFSFAALAVAYVVLLMFSEAGDHAVRRGAPPCGERRPRGPRTRPRRG